MALIPNDGYDQLLNQIGSTLTQGRGRAVQAVNVHLMETYWQVGQHIVEFEQGGQAKAEYGVGLIRQLAKDLTLRHGKGFSRSNVFNMRQFYLAYSKIQTVSGLLSWSHVLELLKVDDPLERGFYEKQMPLERWGVRELKRRIGNEGRAMIRLHFLKTLFIRSLPREMDRISQTLTQRVKELAERYDKPLPALAEQADAMESKVRTHLERMGFAWQ